MLGVRDGSGQSLVSGVSNGDAVAISVEPAGGSKQPTTTPIVAVPVA
jgi:anti-sigma-K factor RskA